MRKVRLLLFLMDMLYVFYFAANWVATPDLWWYPVTNGAMLPSVQEGDLLLIGENKNINVGDIVIYSIQGEKICRRVEQVVKGGYVTKSDAAGINDTFILTKENYEGTVRLVWHNGVMWDEKIRSMGVVMALLSASAFALMFM